MFDGSNRAAHMTELPTPMTELKDATVLIADDETELLEILREWFEREGSRVLTAANGELALQVLASNRVDIVLSDVRMPVMNGIELAMRISKAQDHPKIVFLTGFADVDARDCLGLGVETILPKPVKRQDILGVVRRSLIDC